MEEAKENGTGGNGSLFVTTTAFNLNEHQENSTKIKETHCQISLTFKNWKKSWNWSGSRQQLCFDDFFSLKLQIEIFKITFSWFLPSLNWRKKSLKNLFLRHLCQNRQFRIYFRNSCFVLQSAQAQLGLVENQISKSGEKSMRSLSRLQLSRSKFEIKSFTVRKFDKFKMVILLCKWNKIDFLDKSFLKLEIAIGQFEKMPEYL